MIDDHFFTRKIFCNPQDERLIRENILSDDITVVVHSWLEKGNYLVTKDIECAPKVHSYYEGNDFEKNKITAVTIQQFK